MPINHCQVLAQYYSTKQAPITQWA